MTTADVLPGIHDLTLYRGDTWSQVFTFTQGGSPLALPTTGWQAQVRAPDASGAVVGSFTVDSSDAATGVIVLSATAATVAILREGRYDLQLTEGAVVRTFLRGAVKILRDVTRV